MFRLLRSLHSQAFRLQSIDAGISQLAILQDEDSTVNVYHDQNGSLSFHVPLSELDGGEADYAERVRNAQNQHQQLIKAFFDNSTDPSLFHGRPDLVIEIYDGEAKGIPEAIVLGEIKYSDRQ